MRKYTLIKYDSTRKTTRKVFLGLIQLCLFHAQFSILKGIKAYRFGIKLAQQNINASFVVDF